MLHTVGLANTGNKKAGRFSLGMKQRLSIAIALLNNPQLLILDEPVNGLDPNGIIEMRELLKKINLEQGTTIIISSHLLAEVEKLVTHTGIISKGNLLFQGTLPQLINRQQQAAAVLLQTSDAGKTVQLLQHDNIPATINNGAVVLPVLPKEKLAMLNRLLVNNDIDVYEITTTKNNLEEIFINLVNN